MRCFDEKAPSAWPADRAKPCSKYSILPISAAALAKMAREKARSETSAKAHLFRLLSKVIFLLHKLSVRWWISFPRLKISIPNDFQLIKLEVICKRYRSPKRKGKKLYKKREIKSAPTLSQLFASKNRTKNEHFWYKFPIVGKQTNGRQREMRLMQHPE